MAGPVASRDQTITYMRLPCEKSQDKRMYMTLEYDWPQALPIGAVITWPMAGDFVFAMS